MDEPKPNKKENNLSDHNGEKREKLVIEGNAFYELDLECIRRKQESQKRQRK